MANCLGIYIEEGLIKYAKVTKKDRSQIKVDAFGICFYDDIEEAIDQIVEETSSKNTPISINLSNEMYNYFLMFALLKNKDLEKAVASEFDLFCSDKGYNPNVFISKYIVGKFAQDREKIKVIHVSANKMELNKRKQQFSGYKLSNIEPISMAITNLANTPANENCLIINIEEKTTLVTINDQKIDNIEVLEEGSGNFLKAIAQRENSQSKAYEICKNTTIYTAQGYEYTQEDEKENMEDILITLDNIISQVRKIIDNSLQPITKIYITGTAALTNNIDLYFQDRLGGIKCEILKPYFITKTNEVNMNDYIEVNSAIALALSGLGEGIKGMNFKERTFNDSIPGWLKADVGGKRKGKKIDVKDVFKNDLGQKLDAGEINLIRTAVGFLLLFAIYTGLALALGQQMDKKQDETEKYISDTKSQIALAEDDNIKIKAKTNEYTAMIQNLTDLNDKITDINRNKKAIPNLLNSIMFIIPENVQLISIENTTDRHIVIEAKSDKYEQLGMFKAKLQTDVILKNVISTAGQKDSDVVTVKIEGDLP